MFPDNAYFSLATDARGTEYIRSFDEVVVVALDEAGHALMAVEPAPARGHDVWVLPGGTVTDDEPHDAAAGRELQEELGYAPGRLDYLGELWPWAKYLSVRSFVYLARELTPSKLEGDEDYEIGIERVPLGDLEGLAARPELRDARVLAAFLMARAFLREHAG